MAFDKITASDISGNQVQGAPDFPIGTPQQKKQIFDKLPLKIIERVNALITKLESSAVNGGSSNIGSPPINGIDGTTVLGQLQSLKEQLALAQTANINIGSLEKDKFVDFDGDVMSARLDGYAEAESAADINDTDSVVVAFGKLQKTLNDLIDALQDYKDNIADGTVTADRAKTVTTDLNGRELTNVFVADTAKVKYAALADEATNATKATNDADNNDIRTTYRKTANRVLWYSGTLDVSSGGTVTVSTNQGVVESLPLGTRLEILWGASLSTAYTWVGSLGQSMTNLFFSTSSLTIHQMATGTVSGNTQMRFISPKQFSLTYSPYGVAVIDVDRSVYKVWVIKD